MQIKKDIVVGGDFEIEIPQYKAGEQQEIFSEGYFYSSGRAALFAIIKHIEQMRKDIQTILVPDYICHTVPETIGRTTLRVEVYHLDDNFRVPTTFFNTENLVHKAVLLVNYFGLMSLEEQIKSIHAACPDCVVIEDNVQSLCSMFEESSADYRFTSFRKSLPVADGGWVKTRFKMEQPTEINKFAQYKIAGGILKDLRHYQCFDDKLYLQMLENGEEKIDENIDKAISQFTLDSLSKISLTRFRTLRQRNAEYLVRGLKDMGIEPLLPYDNTKVPLFIPIYLEYRNKVRRALFAKQIFCPVHWPVPEHGYEDYTLGKKMNEHELSLIVDQRYGTREMQMILDTIKENL